MFEIQDGRPSMMKHARLPNEARRKKGNEHPLIPNPKRENRRERLDVRSQKESSRLKTTFFKKRKGKEKKIAYCLYFVHDEEFRVDEHLMNCSILAHDLHPLANDFDTRSETHSKFQRRL